jgi:hypothetical protein
MRTAALLARVTSLGVTAEATETTLGVASLAQQAGV